MMTITRKIEWDMGHRVPNHKSKCRNVHGHRYTAYITLAGETVQVSGDSSEGMVVDFSDMKTIAQEFIDFYLDHGYMGHSKLDTPVVNLLADGGSKTTIVDFIPTAENIGSWLFAHLEKAFSKAFEGKEGYSFTLSKITLYETPNSFVEITKESLAHWTKEQLEARFVWGTEQHVLTP